MLKNKFFLLFIAATFVSNVGTWLFAVAAGWLMSELNSSALYVSLVQTASFLPMLILAVPAGAIGDLYDRRRVVMITHALLIASTLLFAFLVYEGIAGIRYLLLFTLLNGVGAAFAGPVMSAIIPQLVEREQLRAALSVRTIAFNLSRAVGPILGGLLIATYTIDLPFWIDAFSYTAVLVAIYFWQQRPDPSATDLPPEPLRLAMSASIRYLRYTPALYNSIIRAVLFFLSAGALWALMPLIARETLSGGADLYGFLLGGAGAGAVMAGLMSKQITRVLKGGPLVIFASALMSTGLTILGLTTNEALAVVGTFLAGAAWQMGFSSLITSTQYALPRWYGARGMASYIMAMSGSLALGSAMWGFLADETTIQIAHLVAAGLGILLIPVGIRFPLDQAEHHDLRAVPNLPEPKINTTSTDRVRTAITYQLGRADHEQAISHLRRLRNVRYRAGALDWRLQTNPDTGTQLVEHYILYSPRELVRQTHQITQEDYTQIETTYDWLKEHGGSWTTEYFMVMV